MKKSLCILILFFLFFGYSSKIFAQSNYVLPYPSAMPGSIFYKLNLVKEKVMKYWYFGDFGQFDYNLKYSDKYLVEAKTLFEYKQYLFAYYALKKSDQYFKNIQPSLENARKQNKNITQRQNVLKSAGLKHVELLNFIKMVTPDNFVWNPEKAAPTNLNLEKAIKESIKIRENFL